MRGRSDFIRRQDSDNAAVRPGRSGKYRNVKAGPAQPDGQRWNLIIECCAQLNLLHQMPPKNFSADPRPPSGFVAEYQLRLSLSNFRASCSMLEIGGISAFLVTITRA